MAQGSLASHLPKIHLHCHLEGTLRPQTFVELARKHRVLLRYRGAGAADVPAEAIDPSEPYRFVNFQEFLWLFAAVSRALRDPEDYARLAREFVEDALKQRVIYGELFVSPSVWTFFNPQLDVRSTFQAIVAELRAAQPKGTFRLLADVTRNFGAEAAMQTVRTVAGMTEFDVVGISLGGDETRFPARDFAEAFRFARAQGLHCVTHAGEVDGHHSVRDAIELLGAERIGHGIRALDDPDLVALLAERRIALEICPTSNRLTGAAQPHRPHPYVDFDRAGCRVAIDADDPALFGTSIEQEYAEVERVAGPETLVRFVANAVEASFASAGEKKRMAELVERARAELQPQARS